MEGMLFPETKLSVLDRVMIYLAAFFIILSVGCVYTHMSDSGHLAGLVTYIPAVFLIAVVSVRRTLDHDAVLTAVILTVYLACTALLGRADVKNTVAELALVAVLVLYHGVVEKDKKPYLLIAYRDIIFVIAVISLFFWIFGSILHVIPSNSTVPSNWGVPGGGEYKTLKNYYYLYFELDQTFIFGRFITSNRSIFVERAFASFAFSIGWMYELFIEPRKSKTRLIIFTLTMLSTLSMTGLIIVVVALVSYYFFNGTNRWFVNALRILTVPAMILAAYFIVTYLLEVKFSSGHSASSRMMDFINGFQAWLKSPLYGYGYGNNVKIHQMFKTGYSNAVTMILTQGGIMMAVLYILCFFRGVSKGLQRRHLNAALFIAVILLEFTFTAIAFTDIMIYLLLVFAYGGLSWMYNED